MVLNKLNVDRSKIDGVWVSNGWRYYKVPTNNQDHFFEIRKRIILPQCRSISKLIGLCKAKYERSCHWILPIQRKRIQSLWRECLHRDPNALYGRTFHPFRKGKQTCLFLLLCPPDLRSVLCQ